MLRNALTILVVTIVSAGSAVAAKTIAGDYAVTVQGADILMDRQPANRPITVRTILKVIQHGDRITMTFGAIGDTSAATIFKGRVGNGRFAAVWWYRESAHETKVVWGTIRGRQLHGRMIYPRVAGGSAQAPGWLEISFEAKRKSDPKPMGRVNPGTGPMVHGPGEPLNVQADCLDFDPRQLKLKAESGRYLLTDGRSRMKVFTHHQEARSALKTIRHYGLDQHCFVGRPDPSLEYWLADGRAPTGSLAGEDCISFDPRHLELKREGPQWLLTDGHSRMRMFPNRREAEQALHVIRQYGFNKTCYVGRPRPVHDLFPELMGCIVPRGRPPVA